LEICAQLHKETHILTHKGHLTLVEALKKTKYDEHIFKEVQLNMNQRQEDTQVVSRVTTNLMEEHLVKLAKTKNMIKPFMVKLMRDMRPFRTTQPLMKLPWRQSYTIESFPLHENMKLGNLT